MGLLHAILLLYVLALPHNFFPEPKKVVQKKYFFFPIKAQNFAPRWRHFPGFVGATDMNKETTDALANSEIS
jgi:hypothetical protein